MKEITINNEIYIKKTDIKYQPSPIQIVVLKRGWVVVGNVEQKVKKTYIRNASIIRRWGTTNGLGELAMNGKLEETVLDKCLDIVSHNENVIFMMNCNQSKWEKICL